VKPTPSAQPAITRDPAPATPGLTTTLDTVTPGGIWGWLERHPRRSLAIIVAASVLLQLPFLRIELNNDEGGFLFVAGQWGLDNTELYGNQWVDRPPLLLLLFKVLAWLGGSVTVVRVAALVFTAITVMAGFRAGHLINARRGAVVGALVAAGLTASYSIEGYQLTGEKVGGTLVLVSCALTLEAWRGARSASTSQWLALAAGFTAACAFLVKQNFIDAGLFAAVLLLLHAKQAWRLLVAGAVGLIVPIGLTGVWAASSWGPGFGNLWEAIVVFRGDASDVLAVSGLSATERRADELLMFSFSTGIFLVILCFLVEAWQLRGEWRLGTAIAAMLAYGVAAVWIGGSYWPHYLLALIPPLVLAAAFASCASRPRLDARWVAGVVALCGLSSLAGGMVKAVEGDTPREGITTTGDWLAEAAEPGDTVFVAYGAANLIHRSDLDAPYPYSWSLPIRVRDPELTRLTALVESPEAPTWIIEAGDFDWWGLDTPEFHRLRETRYTLVDEVCGHGVYLRNDAPRDLPPTPDC
jgi:hypothetical protein